MVLKRPGGQGGLQQQAKRVALRMRERGVPVTIVSHLRREERSEPADPRLPIVSLWAPHQWSFAAELFRYLCRYRAAYDVVHVHGFGSEILGALAAKRVTGKPVVIKPSTAGPGTKLNAYAGCSRYLPFPLQWMWRQADAWICISEQTRQDVLRLGVDPGSVHLVPNGVLRSEYVPLSGGDRAALREVLGVAPDELVVCAAARVTPHKRVDLLVRVFQQLAGEFPRARLWIMGAGDQWSELRDLVQGSPEASRIRLWGREDPGRVLQRFQAADAFALLSRWEGLSNALLEAMACGLPVVVTDVSGARDVIRSGENGLLVPVDDEAAVTDALRRVLTDGTLRHSLGRNAARTIRDGFDLDLTIDRLLETYRHCAVPVPPR